MSLIPLSDNLAAWKLLPGVSQWVLDAVKKGYRIQFATRPPQFQEVLPTIVGTHQTLFLQEELLSLLRKGAIEHVPLPDQDLGFYSRYFIVPNKRGRGGCIHSVTTTFTKCMDAALVPLRLQGIRVLNYLDDWLILAHSKAMTASHQDVVLALLRILGLRINLEKCVLSPSQRNTFLGVICDSTMMWACLSPAWVASILSAVNSVQLDQSLSVAEAQRVLGLMAAAANVIPLGLLHMRPFQFWLRGAGFHPRRHPLDAIRVMRRRLYTLLTWTRPQFLAAGPTLRACHHHRTLLTDASLSVWVRRSPSCRPCLPSWDLSVVLDMLLEAPFESMESASEKFLTLKMALLLVLASLRRVGDLQALSVTPICLEFAPGMSKAILQRRAGCVPKVRRMAGRPVILQAFCLLPHESAEQERLHLLCPVRALRTYVHRFGSWHKSPSLFICFAAGTRVIRSPSITWHTGW
ncbi:hypothetical protein QTP70_023247 [Hemibagrus guttatus]|uniref:ribonuclease H n=1 Tax=Hemibagrus guttatus TaxID=175788 RepID=A0AAE0REX7_9TELE|nr:hypothetical protein QTP70_023247 [Hemibagrus guttatus]